MQIVRYIALSYSVLYYSTMHYSTLQYSDPRINGPKILIKSEHGPLLFFMKLMFSGTGGDGELGAFPPLTTVKPAVAVALQCIVKQCCLLLQV